MDGTSRFFRACLKHAQKKKIDKGCKGFKAVFRDFSNAFNTLSRQGLLDKFAATNPPILAG